MPAIDWPLLLGLEALSIGAAVVIPYVARRETVRESVEHPGRRAAATFAFARWSCELPQAAFVAPFLMWAAGRGKPGWEGAGDWLFAVGWTAFVIAWLGLARVHAAVFREAGVSDATPASILGARVFVHGWFMFPPLVAGWAVVAFADAPSAPHGNEPIAAVCYLAAVLASGPLVTWPLRRSASAATEAPASLVLEFERLAGDGDRPPVFATPLRHVGISFGLAHRHRRAPRISIDDEFARRAPTAEGVAVLLHELGHHRLGHLRRREWTWKGCLLVVVIGPALLGVGHVAVFVAGLWVAHRYLMLPMWRRQELEADRFAADRCGPDAVAAMLVALHRAGDIPDEFGGSRAAMTHPDLRRRIDALGLDAADFLRPRAA